MDTQPSPISSTNCRGEMASLAEVRVCNVLPACIASREGGPTPMKVPMTKGNIGTPMTGDAMLINQLGRKGVIRRKIM